MIIEKEKCCACRACVQACPKNAVSTFYDNYGFERVTIDESKCVKCGICESVCPILNPNKIDSKTNRQTCGSAYCKDLENKRNGSSGGLFGIFAQKIIAENGVVYGAAFDENLHLKTTRADDFDQLKKLYKSKYLLCDTTGAFKQIKTDLVNGKKVLYCSTPCQLNALKNYLKKEYENLLCIEFVCHGVGGQKQFNDSISFIEQKKNIKIMDFGFREKFSNASSHYYYYYYKDLRSGKEKRLSDIYMTFPYYYAYCDRLTCRESCYSCTYATEDRVGDITIGDFHNIGKYEPKIDRFAGVSMFICNTEKGQKFFDLVKDDLVVKEYDWQIIKNNNRFDGIEIMPAKRNSYIEMIAKGDYAKCVKTFFAYWKDWRYYYYHMPRFLRSFGNKLLRK